MTQGINTASVTAAAAGSAGTVIATQLLVSVFNKFTGTTYSADEIKKLQTLEQLYTRSLEIASAPHYWTLNSQNQPTHIVNDPLSWASFTRELTDQKGTHQFFHSQSKSIADFASVYLTKRAKRWFGRGSSGDLLEQFMGEWIHFALNDLPTFSYHDIDKIKQRINYLDAVTNGNIFKYGTFKRTSNKFTTLLAIREELQNCLDVMIQEKLRLTAREAFAAYQTDSSALLLASANTLYYTRNTNVAEEPMAPKKFLFDTTSYATVKKSHSGAMLLEAIQYAGLETFGLAKQTSPILPSSNYFDSHLNPLPLRDWPTLQDDLPAWVEPADRSHQLLQLQGLTESFLHLAQFKKLVADAYDLTGEAGSAWAFGDQYGRKSLECLLFLLETELDRFKQRLDTLYGFHSKARTAYNIAKQLNGDQGANPNFNLVNDQLAKMTTYHDQLKKSTAALRDQLAEYPKDSPERIDEKKCHFYKTLVTLVEKLHPEHSEAYQLLKLPTVTASKTSNGPVAPRFTLKIKANPRFENYYYLDQPQFKRYADLSHPGGRYRHWKLGGKYADWMKGFFTRHEPEFAVHQRNVIQFKATLKEATTPQQIRNAAKRLEQHFESLLLQIDNERPRWRFKLSLWPIRTKGWPFNRDADRFANQLRAELLFLKHNVAEAVSHATQHLPTETLPIAEVTKPPQSKFELKIVINPDNILSSTHKKVLAIVQDPQQRVQFETDLTTAMQADQMAEFELAQVRHEPFKSAHAIATPQNSTTAASTFNNRR